jgi:putative nucleotidyltransferase-like protein
MTAQREASWLVHYSDPMVDAAKTDAPRLPFPLAESHMARIEAQAGRHGVIMAVGRNVAAAVKSGSALEIGGNDEASSEAGKRLADALESSCLAHLRRNMILNDVAVRIGKSLSRESLPAVVVKGPDFATNVYGGLHMRAFSDIDILVDQAASEAVEAVVADLGFVPVVPDHKHKAYTERQFLREDRNGENDLVELHTDMVHAPKLRRSMSLTHQDYAGRNSEEVTMAGRLVLAALHGATSHQFDRLQYVVDVLMIARAGVEAHELKDRAARAGAETAVLTGLDLAVGLFGCEASAALARQLQPRHDNRLARRLVGPASVVAAQSSSRWLHSWRRQVYRWMLTRQPELVRRA